MEDEGEGGGHRALPTPVRHLQGGRRSAGAPSHHGRRRLAWEGERERKGRANRGGGAAVLEEEEGGARLTRPRRRRL